LKIKTIEKSRVKQFDTVLGDGTVKLLKTRQEKI